MKGVAAWFIGCWSALLLSSLPATANELENIRVWPGSEHTRVVFDLTAAPEYSYFTLYDQQPYRLVVDLTNTTNAVDFDSLSFQSDVLHVIRPSNPPDQNDSRVVLELPDQSDVNLSTLPPDANRNHRLVIDIPVTSRAEPRVTRTTADREERPTRVVIDAGHGGRDPGSIGPSGLLEKHVTMAVAHKLADRINADPAMEAVLTRSGDYAVSLEERARKARREEADIFVSLHADSFRTSQPRGATVWVLSATRGEREYRRAVENPGRLEEELVHIGHTLQNAPGDNPYLGEALLHMRRSDAQHYTTLAAESVLGQLERITAIHRRDIREAGFAVLTSLGVPSILIELGFISNPEKEQKLGNSRHQEALAGAVYAGLRRHFIEHPPDNTLFARMADQNTITHVVAAGESLSVIAQEYQTSVQAIRERNELGTTMIRVGQTLEIPVDG